MVRAVSDPNLLALLEGAPEGGTGVPAAAPQQGWQVSPQDQALRDRARLALLERETQDNPTDPALAKEVSIERRKQGVAAPTRRVVSDPALLAALNEESPQAAPARDSSLKATMAEQTNEDLGTALKTGIANSASRTVRAIGTTLLPKAAEAWAEKHGLMPTAQDIELLKAGTDASNVASGTSLVGDVVTEILPAAKVMKGAKTFKQAAPRAAAVGGTIGGMRSEATDLPGLATDVAEGGVGGLLGEGVGRAAANVLTRVAPRSDAARGLMDRGIVPTLGDAADDSTFRGKALRFLERQVESMPITGIPQRAAKERVTRDLFTEAADMATPPGRTLPTGNRAQVLDRLGEQSSQDFGAALAGTTVRTPHAMKVMVDNTVDTLKGRHYVSDDVADAIKQEMNQKLWAGIRGGEISGQGAHNFIEDMFSGLNSTRGNSNAQQLVNELALGFKNHLNDVATQQGFDLPGIRQSAANIHALRRAGGSAEGVSGAQLMHGVQANNRATSSLDATYDLQNLAEQAQGITHARNPMGSRNPAQFVRDFIGFSSGGAIPALMLGGVNNSQHAKRLLLGDPAYREALLRALSAPATITGAHQMSSEESE